MSEEHDINKSIDDFLSEPEPSSNNLAIKIGIAVFIAIVSAFFVREAYQQYQDNYWKDIGNGTFINVGKSKRHGDLATAVIKMDNRQVNINVNCNKETYWSDHNNGWFSATSKFSTEYQMISTACSPKS